MRPGRGGLGPGEYGGSGWFDYSSNLEYRDCIAELRPQPVEGHFYLGAGFTAAWVLNPESNATLINCGTQFIGVQGNFWTPGQVLDPNTATIRELDPDGSFSLAEFALDGSFDFASWAIDSLGIQNFWGAGNVVVDIGSTPGGNDLANDFTVNADTTNRLDLNPPKRVPAGGKVYVTLVSPAGGIASVRLILFATGRLLPQSAVALHARNARGAARIIGGDWVVDGSGRALWIKDWFVPSTCLIAHATFDCSPLAGEAGRSIHCETPKSNLEIYECVLRGSLSGVTSFKATTARGTNEEIT